MDASDFTARLIVAINNAHALINGGSVDAIDLIMEGRALAKAFHPISCLSDQVHRLAALMIASIAEASISVERSDEWQASLNLCRRSRDDLRRLQPFDCDAIRKLWVIGHKADELAVMSARVRSPRKTVRHSARPLQNRPFAELLDGYGDLQEKPEHAPARTEEIKTSPILTGPEAEGQYFSPSDYWTNTGPK